LAFIPGKRRQSQLLPMSIEEYVAEDDPVRVYDAFVERLDFEALGMDLNEHKIGPPEYDPKTMLKLLVFGYSYGIRSSRRLEQATYHNLSFIWLTGGLKPDHKTIARFRREHTSALRKVLKQCAQLCLKLKLIQGNTLFIDGTKMGANASLKRSWTKKKCAKALARVEARIRSILAKCEAVDQAEAGQVSLAHLRPELAQAEAREKEIEAIVKELEATSQNSLNTTDPECAGVLKSKSGAMAGYNVQAVVDEKHGLLVSTDVVTERNDQHQFDRQVKQAEETLERPCAVACADAGYANVNALKEPHEHGVKVIVPPAPSNSRASGGPFDKTKFHYDPERDVYVCPEGHLLGYRKTHKKSRQWVYQIKKPQHCRDCPHFGPCTESKQGRSVVRLFDEPLKEFLAAQYGEASSQAVYKLRQQKAELPFGHIKRNLGVRSFLLRGLAGAKAEASLLAACFNLTRMIKLLGVAGSMTALAGV